MLRLGNAQKQNGQAVALTFALLDKRLAYASQAEKGCRVINGSTPGQGRSDWLFCAP